MSGRGNLISDEKKQLPTMVTMDQETKNVVNALGKGKSFAEKLRNIVHLFKDQSTLLIRYDNDAQKETMSPTVINPGAFQVYNSLYGPVIEGLPSRPKKMCSDVKYAQEILVPHFEKEGYKVQLVLGIDFDNSIDLWICPKSSDATICASCKCLEEIESAIAKVRSQEVRNDF